MFSDTPEDKVAECKTQKNKYLQRKSFGAASIQIEWNFSTCIVALKDGKKILVTNYCGLHCL